MIDPKLIRERADVVKAGMQRKQLDTSVVDAWVALDVELRTLRQATEEKQAALNAASKDLATASPDARDAMRVELRALSESIKVQDATVADMERELLVLHRQIANMPADDVPDGLSDADNVVLRHQGDVPVMSFTPQSHEILCERMGLVDTERATKVAGTKFYYLIGELALLEQAVMRYALDTLYRHGFTIMSVPNMVKTDVLFGAGHFSAPEDAERGDAYKIDRDDLFLVGTAEPPLVAFHSGEVLLESELPKRYAALSPAYRREAGTYGRETRGLYRVHQFQKVEMVSLTTPGASPDEHAYLLSISEEILQGLGLHYQVVLNCAGDLGHPQVKKWDIETWMPGMQKYGETHSCSNDGDYQARSLKIRYRTADGATPQFVHTLNNTALSSARILIAILENYQHEDGSVAIPPVLHQYLPFTEIRRS
jgi:seryl-tRNA synthetase